MASTVIQAFNDFIVNTINLDGDQVRKAKSSRSWLYDRIENFPTNDSTFPLLYSGNHLDFGSFARKTKTRTLDDIDMMLCLNADGCTYLENSIDNITIYFPDNYAGRLNSFRHTTVGKEHTLSSRRVTNKFVQCLSNVDQYSSAEIKRDGEAATLNLASYD